MNQSRLGVLFIDNLKIITTLPVKLFEEKELKQLIEIKVIRNNYVQEIRRVGNAGVFTVSTDGSFSRG